MTTDQLRIPRHVPGSPARGLTSGIGLALLVAGAAAVGPIAVSRPEWYRGAFAVALIANLVVLGMRWPRVAAVATLLFLPFLALIRRLLIVDAGFTSNDPLLLVGPSAALFLLYQLYVVEGRSHDRLSKLVVALLAVAVAQVFNPFAVGGILAAAGGLLFLGVPLVWFLIGRALGDDRTVSFLLCGTMVVAGLAAIYGLLQTQFGTIASWDQTWFDLNGYSALQVQASETSSVIRPFSTFSSNQEYAAYTAIGVTLAVAFVLRGRLRPVVVLPLLLLALVLAGGRGSLVSCALAIVLMLALMTRSWLGGLLVLMLGVTVAYGVATTFGTRIDRAAGLRGNAVVERTVSGILKPLDPSTSTAITHWENFVRGIGEGIAHPAGHGTGATTIATRLTGSQSKDSEIDVSNVFVSLGIVGGSLYLAIIVLLFRAVLARYIRHRDALSLAVAGLLVVMLGQWLNGGLYAIAPLFWFLAGWSSKPEEPAQQGL